MYDMEVYCNDNCHNDYDYDYDYDCDYDCDYDYDDDYNYEYDEMNLEPTLREIFDKETNIPKIRKPPIGNVDLKLSCDNSPLWADFQELLPKKFTSLGRAPKQLAQRSSVASKNLIIKKNFKFTHKKQIPFYVKGKKNILCNNIINEKKCNFSFDCNFAHRYNEIELCSITACRYVICISDTLYINSSDLSDYDICKNRHNNENIESYILRLGLQTIRDQIIIYISKEMLDTHIKQILKNAKKCSLSSLVTYII